MDFETWLAEMPTTPDAECAALLSEIKADARRAGVLARKRKPADETAPVDALYCLLERANYRRVLVQKRLAIASGWADDRLYIRARPVGCLRAD